MIQLRQTQTTPCGNVHKVNVRCSFNAAREFSVENFKLISNRLRERKMEKDGPFSSAELDVIGRIARDISALARGDLNRELRLVTDLLKPRILINPMQVTTRDWVIAQALLNTDGLYGREDFTLFVNNTENATREEYLGPMIAKSLVDPGCNLPISGRSFGETGQYIPIHFPVTELTVLQTAILRALKREAYAANIYEIGNQTANMPATVILNAKEDNFFIVSPMNLKLQLAFKASGTGEIDMIPGTLEPNITQIEGFNLISDNALLSHLDSDAIENITRIIFQRSVILGQNGKPFEELFDPELMDKGEELAKNAKKAWPDNEGIGKKLEKLITLPAAAYAQSTRAGIELIRDRILELGVKKGFFSKGIPKSEVAERIKGVIDVIVRGFEIIGTGTNAAPMRQLWNDFDIYILNEILLSRLSEREHRKLIEYAFEKGLESVCYRRAGH